MPEWKTSIEICKVCQILDNTELRVLCRWCGSCDNWICLEDWSNFVRRGKAIVKGVLQ